MTLKAPLLMSFVAITLCLIILLEYLSRTSRQKGGIAFAEGEFSGVTTFAYLYLPTIIAVIYSLVYSWIDLDAKRLEPYLQMSKPQGAKPKDSIFLHYPFDFVAFVPYRAICRG